MQEKIDRVKDVLKKHEIDAWVIFCHHSHDIHAKYLLEKWLASSTMILVPQIGDPKVITSPMESMMINDQVFNINTYQSTEELVGSIKQSLTEFEKGSKIALNFADEDVMKNLNRDILPYGTFKELTRLNSDLTYVSAKDVIYDIRSVKTQEEINKHKTAVKLAEELMEDIIEPAIKPGKTENEIAALIEYECNKRGGVAFDPIVASGANAAVPHHHASEKKIEKNNVLLIDYGVAYKFSNSDITHTYWIGPSDPSEDVLRAYEAVDKAKTAAFNKIKAGVIAADVETAVRAVFEEYGYDHEKLFMHSTGHPLGIETHDIGVGIRKAASDGTSHPLIENSVITVEPGLYFADKFGIRLEDDIVVTKEGLIRLSHTPSEMIKL